MMPRSEEDLQAAFQLAAQDAPSSEQVLAKARAAQVRDPFAPARVKRARARQWLPIAAVAAVVVAIAVPVGFAISSGDNAAKSSSASESFAASGKDAAGAASSAASGEIAAPSSGGAVGGPVNTAPVNPIIPTPDAVPACTTDEIALTMSWTAAGTGLRGTLTARNVSGLACDLAIKPAIYPLGPDRVRLDVTTVMTAEGYAGPSLLQPDATASSTITWNSWCGARADSGAQIVWDGQGAGPATISVSGPTSPSCVNGTSGNISSTWFAPLS